MGAVIGRFEGSQTLIPVPERAFELSVRDQLGQITRDAADIIKRPVAAPIDVVPSLNTLHGSTRC